MRLFASETGGIPGRFRIYWFRVEDKNGVAKVDLRPCINPQGEIGMYDLVRETFCGNGGTGVFEINEVCLPSGYSACKWIESCGTQWINTQFTPTCLDSATMNFRFRSLSNEYIGLFCARKNGKTFTCVKSNSTNGNRIRFDCKEGTIGYYGTSPSVNIDYNIAMNGSTRVCTVNGMNVSTSGQEGSFTVGSPLVLFAMHQGAAEMTNMASLRLYSFAVTDSSTGTILCDLQPCVRNSDDKPGLYDRINKRFLTNGGTGEFTVSGGAILIVF